MENPSLSLLCVNNKQSKHTEFAIAGMSSCKVPVLVSGKWLLLKVVVLLFELTSCMKVVP